MPQHNARLEHPDLLVTNHQLRDVGHLSLAVHSGAVHAVVKALTRAGPAPEQSATAPVEDTVDTATPTATASPPTASA